MSERLLQAMIAEAAGDPPDLDFVQGPLGALQASSSAET
ncbi:unnamed protein product [[Actinomadura] parvosata subsp. kistnae]|nr:unnamed protein product [Actinomadura parvosata subsp. kistnae]